MLMTSWGVRRPTPASVRTVPVYVRAAFDFIFKFLNIF